MKVILYMAITANGMIAKKNHDVPWTDDEWIAYSSKVKKIGNFIVGSVTYPLFEKKDFEELGDPYVVVLTTKEFKKSSKHVSAKSLPKAIELLKRKGFKTALICGGAKADTSALKSGIIDEIYLDVEPFIIGDGIPLFNSINKDFNLKLLGMKKTGRNSVQLRYKVIK